MEYGKTYTLEGNASSSDFGMYFVGYDDGGIVTEALHYVPGKAGGFVTNWTPTVTTTTKMRLRGYATSLPSAGITELTVS